MDKSIFLLLGFNENDSEMVVIRWQRFIKYLARDNWKVKWFPVKVLEIEKNWRCRMRLFLKMSLEANRACKDQYSSIVATFPYIEPLIIAVVLKIFHPKKQLLIEFRDIYARNYLYNFSAPKRNIEIIRELVFLLFADRLIFLTEGIKRHYEQYYPWLNKVKQGAIITNGYDPDDYLDCSASQDTFENRIVITHAGTFYGSRNPELLLRVLTEILLETPVFKSKILFKFFGKATDYPINKRIEAFNLGDNVIYMGEILKENVSREYANTDLNLILTHSVGSEYALPGKLFDYIGAKRPIWAITNDIFLRAFIDKYNLGFVSDCEFNSIKSTLLNLINNIDAIKTMKNNGALEEFEYANITKEMVEVLNS